MRRTCIKAERLTDFLWIRTAEKWWHPSSFLWMLRMGMDSILSAKQIIFGVSISYVLNVGVPFVDLTSPL